MGQQFGPKCARNDRIGCGIHSENIGAGLTTVFFTKNGKEVGVFKHWHSVMLYFKHALAELSVCILLSLVSSPIVSLHPSPVQVGSVEIPASAEGLFPAVGMHSMGEEVKVDLQAEWFLEEDDSMMMVDSHEDDWGRLYDVRVSGTVRSRKRIL